MEKNEIKSFRTKITLKEYFEINNTLCITTFKIGNIKYYNFENKIQCQHNSTNNVLFLIGRHYNKTDIYLFESNNSITEIDIKDVSLYVEVVLKEQIKDLKYVEQLSLFEDGKTGKDSNNE